MKITDIRRDIADVLGQGLSGWNVSAFVPDAPVPPLIVVGFPQDVTYHMTQSGRAKVALPVMVVSGLAEADSAQQLMAEALSTAAGSVVAVLDGASSPSNAWFGKLNVVSAGDMRILTSGAANVLVANINVECIA